MAPSLSSTLLAIQGFPITLFAISILQDKAGAGFGDVPDSVAHVISFSLLSLSTAYLTTALAPRRTRHIFLLATGLLRIPAAIVFARDGTDARGAPAWDYGNAVVDVLVVGVEWGLGWGRGRGL